VPGLRGDKLALPKKLVAEADPALPGVELSIEESIERITTVVKLRRHGCTLCAISRIPGRGQEERKVNRIKAIAKVPIWNRKGRRVKAGHGVPRLGRI
jgi:hypothetical protein